MSNWEPPTLTLKFERILTSIPPRVLPLDVDRDDVWLHCSLAELVAQAVRQTEYPAEAGNDVERPA